MAFAIPLKYIVLTNWFLACWAVFAEFLGATYLFANISLFGVGIWCLIDKHGTEPFTVYGSVYVYSIVSDFICIGRYAKKDQITSYGDNDQKFALAMAAINLIAKFVFLYFLWVEYNTRGAAHVDGSSTAPLAAGAYDPIAHSQQPTAGGFQAGSFVGGNAGSQQHLPPVMGGQQPMPIGGSVAALPSGGSVGGNVGGSFQSGGQTGY